MVDLNKKLGLTQFPLRTAVQSLNGKDPRWDALCAEKTLKDVEVETVAGNGYLSVITRISFFLEDERDRFSVILKVPTVDNVKKLMGKATLREERVHNDIEKFAKDLVAFHDKEILFYEKIAVHFKQLSLPTIYKAQPCSSVDDLPSAFLLMEDLGQKGGLVDVRMGLSKPQVESVITTIADFHAYSLTLPKEALESLPLPTFGEQKQNGSDGNGDAIVNKLLTLPYEYFRKYEKPIRRFLKTAKLADDIDIHKKFDVPPVLCHGDLWVNNIFFKKDEDGNITDDVCAFLDWQLAHPNSGLTDIAHLILLGVNAELKLRHMDDWLRLYYDTFEERTRLYSVGNPYTPELVRRMFYAHYTQRMIFTFLLLSHMCEQEKDAKIRTSIAGRIISGFEVIRKNYE